MIQPSISKLDTWQSMENLIQAVIDTALKLLIEKDSLAEAENDITRELYKCLRTAWRKHNASGKLAIPILEANNQPSASDETKVPRENKRPDIQFPFYDETELDDQECHKYYIVECKRLGKKARSGGIFNENYILEGIKRFIDEQHGYGKDTQSGTMIGYIQNMDFETILLEVNTTASSHSIAEYSIPIISLSENGWQEKSISRLSSNFNRTFSPSPFLLHHLWVDLRTKYSSPKKVSRRKKAKLLEESTQDKQIGDKL